MTARMSDSATSMYRKYYLVSFWLESTLYGIPCWSQVGRPEAYVFVMPGLYVFLFATAMAITVKRKRNYGAKTPSFFLWSIVAMFILTSIHNFMNVYRMSHAFVTIPETDPSIRSPIRYLRNWNNWDCLAFGVILALVTWLGDALVIYRCFLVWQRSYIVVTLPAVLLLASFATTTVNLYWFGHPSSIPLPIMQLFLNVTFPLNLLQNVLTTGLIAIRIWSQHRQTVQAGVKFVSAGGALSLLMVLRIVVESAMIYTIQMLIITILWYLGHPAIVIVQHATLPSIGIVFVLMIVRTYLPRSRTIDELPSFNFSPVERVAPWTNDDPQTPVPRRVATPTAVDSRTRND